MIEVTRGCTTISGTVGTSAPLAVTTWLSGNSAIASRLAMAIEEMIQVT
jgi:hypothetical protein